MKILDEFVEKISVNSANLLENRIRLVIKDKPKWMPEFLYKFLIKELFEIQKII